jgi:hypothetical protein
VALEVAAKVLPVDLVAVAVALPFQPAVLAFPIKATPVEQTLQT